MTDARRLESLFAWVDDEEQDATSILSADPVYFHAIPNRSNKEAPRRVGQQRKHTYSAAEEPVTQSVRARGAFKYGPQTVPMLVGGEFVPFLLPSAH